MRTRVKIVEHVAIILVTTRVNVFLDLWEKIVKVKLYGELAFSDIFNLMSTYLVSLTT